MRYRTSPQSGVSSDISSSGSSSEGGVSKAEAPASVSMQRNDRTKGHGAGHPRARSIADALTIRRLTIDDLANVRYLHSLAIRCLGEDAAEDDVDDYLRIIATPQYGDLLLSERHVLAFYGDDLVATAGWSFSSADGPVARLSSVIVSPLFTRLGIARRLVREVEADARNLGFERLEAPLPTHASHFLRRIGFVVEAGEGVIARAAPSLGLARRLAPARQRRASVARASV